MGARRPSPSPIYPPTPQLFLSATRLTHADPLRLSCSVRAPLDLSPLHLGSSSDPISPRGPPLPPLGLSSLHFFPFKPPTNRQWDSTLMWCHFSPDGWGPPDAPAGLLLSLREARPHRRLNPQLLGPRIRLASFSLHRLAPLAPTKTPLDLPLLLCREPPHNPSQIRPDPLDLIRPVRLNPTLLEPGLGHLKLLPLSPSATPTRPVTTDPTRFGSGSEPPFFPLFFSSLLTTSQPLFSFPSRPPRLQPDPFQI